MRGKRKGQLRGESAFPNAPFARQHQDLVPDSPHTLLNDGQIWVFHFGGAGAGLLVGAALTGSCLAGHLTGSSGTVCKSDA